MTSPPEVAGQSRSPPTAVALPDPARIGAGIYARPLPSAVMFPIRSVFEGEGDDGSSGGIYRPKPVAYIVWKNVMLGTGIGIFAATFQNAYFNRGQHWLPIFTQFGRTIGLSASVFTAFAGTRALVANVRQENHWTNGAAGGCAAGFLIGLRGGRIVPAVAGCVVGAPIMGWYEFAVPPSGKIRQLDNALERYERLEKRHLPRKHWDDIHPPPGQGYGVEVYPGYKKSYTENGVY